MDDTLLEMHENEIDKKLEIAVVLEKIHCFDEGDGFGKAEPYLLPIFFKIDGEQVYFETIETLTLGGKVQLHLVDGGQQNLGVEKVDAGDIVTIPSKIGKWRTTLKPIAIHDYDNWALAQGVIGVFCVLMEQDNMSSRVAKACYKKLAQGIESALNEAIPNLNEQQRSLSAEEVNDFAESISESVQRSVIQNQNVLENLWTAINQDDVIGWECFIYKHSELLSKKKKSFSRRWKNEGDWKICGSIRMYKS
ncbi:hypothetical protein [Candidatus Uabimicrobium sp. HlEnr_7]|uniref:hypothetical protein n=1 Tax=Candidatus Uabimicrobium helgolandensis TaxID=3095367 RepID=UPI0035584B4A